ncbi:hypothetical protein GOBAR_AA09251 [Gossypium barbadense]|uniref:Leucine-rich repeat-containing N-terminal plant-type domain-containing protein n=1 Tax=Gossypium barbadense TaxID=3634 RepID=A0A2P5Y739_GOSBA|nr:hypothetical protein GOBAR_AA09251 [Gossypium barbadense]
MDIRHSNNPCSNLLLCFVVLLLLVSSCSGNSNVGVRCMESERQQLLDFKEGLMDPFGWLRLGLGYGGEIPSHLGNLSHLQVLNLGGNFGLRAEDLVWLSVNMLPSLVRLYLDGFQLKSLDLTLPSLNLTSLEVLDLFYNLIKSPLPHWFSNLTNLQVLNLRSNKFYGSIPFWIGSLCKLRLLRLNSNRIHGRIIGVLDRFSACQNNSLEILYLGGNYLVGSLPQSLGTLRNLQELDLNTNFFWGSNPASIGNLSSLEFLELSDNNLNGTIPESFWRLAKLSTMSLESNQMEVSNAGISDIVEEEWPARLFSSCWFVDLSNNLITAKQPSRIYSEKLEIFRGPNPTLGDQQRNCIYREIHFQVLFQRTSRN